MDGFTYTNIFDTKGIEYIIIITFLLVIILFWNLINRPLKIKTSIQHAIKFLNDKVLRIPKGIFYNSNHTWAYLEPGGEARTGIDDLLVHITGPVSIIQVLHAGDQVKKGDKIAELHQNDKVIEITASISGEIAFVNELLKEQPDLLNEDPYKKGWFYKIQPSNWVEETKDYIIEDSVPPWFQDEIVRFKDYIANAMKKSSPASSHGVVLQDGGELLDFPLSGFSSEIWKDFQESYLEGR